MITTLGKEQIANLILGVIDKIQIRIDSVEQDIAFVVEEVDGDRVVFAGLVPEATQGLIDRVRLINTNEDVFAERIENINKPAGNFLTLKFAYRITEEAIT